MAKLAHPNDYRGVEHGCCAVLGNGPSLKTVALNRLAVPTVGINRSHNLIKSEYHCFVAQGMISEVVSGHLEGSGPVFVPQRFLSRKQSFTRSFWRSCSSIVAPFSTTSLKKRFEYNLAAGVDANFGGILGIMVAFFVGFNTIYLIGFDEHGKDGHFYDENTAVADRKVHVARLRLIDEWLNWNTDKKVLNCNTESAIPWFPHAKVPI